MTPQAFLEHFETFAAAPNGISKLRELILQLAVQGKLGTQDQNDEPAPLLRSRILAKRRILIETGVISGFATDAEWPDGVLPYSLPDGWEWIRLGELGGFLGGGTPSKERAEFWDGRIPWVSPKDMKRPYIDDAIDHVSQLGVNNSSGKMIPKGSLLMVVRGMILAHSFPVALAMGELTINQDMKALQLALPELGEYLLRCCTACKSRMLESVERSSHGTCRLPTEAVANFPIPLPPLAEQRRIVEKVDQLLGLCGELAARQAAQREKRQRLVGATLDRLVSTRNPAEFPTHAHRLRNHFDQLFDTPTTIPQLRQTILQMAVQGQLVPQDSNDEPADVLLKKIVTQKATLVNQRLLKPAKVVGEIVDVLPFEVPSSWIWAKLGEICLNVTDGFHNTPKTQPCGVPYLTAQHVKPDGLNFDNGLFVSMADHQELVTKTRPKRGDVLVVNIGAGCGTPAIIDVDFEFSFKNVAILNRPDGVETRYLFIHLLGKHAATLAELTKGGAQPFLSLGVLRETLIPLPPTAEQKRIVTKVTELLSQCAALEAKLTQAQSATTQLLSSAVHHLLEQL